MIYNWLNDETSKILINMIKKRINTKEKLNYYIGPSNMKLISFTSDEAHYTIIVDKDSKIHYPADFSEQMEGIQQQVTNYIILDKRECEALQETREYKLNKLI